MVTWLGKNLEQVFWNTSTLFFQPCFKQWSVQPSPTCKSLSRSLRLRNVNWSIMDDCFIFVTNCCYHFYWVSSKLDVYRNWTVSKMDVFQNCTVFKIGQFLKLEVFRNWTVIEIKRFSKLDALVSKVNSLRNWTFFKIERLSKLDGYRNETILEIRKF